MLASPYIHKNAKRVLVAMSGGVDSSVVAYLLKQQGMEVVGVTLRLVGANDFVQKDFQKSCCSLKDIMHAQQVASRIGIPHYVLDYASKFEEKVIQPFVESYEKGQTPIPCVECNDHIKFKDLFDSASKFDVTFVATGHYVRRLKKAGELGLYKGLDSRKDQSYFLFKTRQEQLQKMLFPLGHLPKTKTRSYAEAIQLINAQKPDSQDICFVPNGKYAEFIQTYNAKNQRPTSPVGAIVHEDGTFLGQHRGLIYYTVGQRHGLGISYSEPLFVTRLDSVANQVIVGGKEFVYKRHFTVDQLNWLLSKAPQVGQSVLIRVRSAKQPQLGYISGHQSGTWELSFETPELAITPGQAAVLYDPLDEDRVLGGGTIQTVLQ